MKLTKGWVPYIQHLKTISHFQVRYDPKRGVHWYQKKPVAVAYALNNSDRAIVFGPDFSIRQIVGLIKRR